MCGKNYSKLPKKYGAVCGIKAGSQIMKMLYYCNKNRVGKQIMYVSYNF